MVNERTILSSSTSRIVSLPPGKPSDDSLKPTCVIGLETGRITFWSGFQRTSARFSAMVFPVTVTQSPCRRPPSSSAFISSGTPPTSPRSFIT